MDTIICHSRENGNPVQKMGIAHKQLIEGAG